MRDRDELSPMLRDAVRELRSDNPPSDIWRRRLLHDVAAAPRPAVGGKRWAFRPLHAIAAGLVCALVGAAAATVVARRSADAPAPVVASAPESVVRFTLDAPAASTVTLVGDFNGWTTNGLPLRRSTDGRTWIVEVPLAPGRYAYSFVVDGKLAADPAAPKARDEFGATNSVVMVKGS